MPTNTAEDTTPVTDETNAAAEAQEVATEQIAIDGKEFTITEVTKPGRKGKGGKESAPTTYIVPVVADNTGRGAFLTAVLDAAEKAVPGSGTKLFEKITGKWFQSAAEVMYDKDTGALYLDRIVPALIAVRHTSGINEEALQALRDEVDVEVKEMFALFALAISDKDAYVAKLQELGYTVEVAADGTIDCPEFTVRGINLTQRLEDIESQKRELEDNKAKRAKARQEKAAKKKTPAPAAAAPAA